MGEDANYSEEEINDFEDENMEEEDTNMEEDADMEETAFTDDSPKVTDLLQSRSEHAARLLEYYEKHFDADLQALLQRERSRRG